MLKDGLYEQVINKNIEKELKEVTDKYIDREKIDNEEASKILAKYVASVVEKGLENIKDNHGGIDYQIDLVNSIVETILNMTGETDFDTMFVERNAEQLLALLDKKNKVESFDKKFKIIRPETSICQSSLFTGARHEPSMVSELKKEIKTSDQIDMLVSFVKWSGLRLIIEELRDFVKKGGKLRIITTSYMGATDVKAIEELRTLVNTEVKVSYDTKRTRLHAKAYIFYRNTGFTTAYVGSSNLSNAAISSGLEWNTKVTMQDLPDTIKKINATFETYWNSNEFEFYTVEKKEKLAKALRAEKYMEGQEHQIYTFDIQPYSYQQEILDKLDAVRSVRGEYRNLIVAATGTGKTVISAFDYKRFRQQNKGKACRLLFVAHREEILKQSIYCFRGVLKDANFGDLFVGSYKPENIEHLFISIQTFNSQDFTIKTSKDFYDFIIIDEFHHAAAPTYQKLLLYYKPKILLGLTATPERMDGKSILEYFSQRIAAEIRLPEAIERKLLCPFQYFGVTDTVNLENLHWVRGGYDKTELSNVYTISGHIANIRANLIIDSLMKYVTDLNDVKGLGFCVSIEHAAFMARHFNQYGIKAISLTGQSSEIERNTAKQRLIDGEIRVIFVVDIYNEGVDIPEVNTILFLRPTESLTVFLQQLGRGLRLSDNKDCLTVLDFIGCANKKYNFENKFMSLLSNTTRSIQKEIETGFVSVPSGCYIQLEKKAKEYIMKNISSSLGSKTGIISKLATFKEDSGLNLTLDNFINYYHISIASIYVKESFSRLCVLAAVKDDFQEPQEDLLRKAFPKICAIDSRRWLSFLINILSNLEKFDLYAFDEGELRMLQMFQFTVWQKSAEECGFNNVKESLMQLRNNPTMYEELLTLLQYNYEHIDFIDRRVELDFDCPIDLHCTYTRNQILVGMDFMKPATVREGVKYLPEKNLDIFFITLNKSDKEYSPTTMYNDYSVNEKLFHWQSQSTTSESSVTGQRYINHCKNKTRVLLFVREFKKDTLGAAPYTFLGVANYVSHDGSKPMNIIWRLDNTIPAKYLKKTNKLAIG